MELGLRRTTLVMTSEKLDSLGYYQQVAREFPADVPNALLMPAVLVVRRTESIEYGTNLERTSSFGLSVIPFFQAETDIELVKCDEQERIEEALAELFVSSEWRSLNLQLLLEQVDAGPLALSAYGIDAIYPPYGALRMDFVATFDYTA